MNGDLHDRCIIVTRPQGQADELIALLRDAGADVLHVPMMSIEEERRPEDDALFGALPMGFDWIAFTSRNAVRMFTRRLGEPRPLLPRIAVVGAATAMEVERSGWAVDLIAARADGSGLAEALAEVGAQSVLYPCAAEAGDFAELLCQKNVEVRSLIVYRTQLREQPIDAAMRFDAVLFASASAVRAWSRCAPSLPVDVRVVCIGETTAAAARAAGLPVRAVAVEAGDLGLVESLRLVFAVTSA